MHTLKTVSEVLNDLKSKGYDVDFNLDDNCLICHSNALKIYPDDFVIDKHYRFEGMSDPADEAIVYAISSAKHNVKGTLVDGYGISSNEISQNLISALKVKEPTGSTGNSIETKSNEATSLRPEGNRNLDAFMVTMDLNILKSRIKKEESYLKGDRNAITLFKSDYMRIVLIALHEGAEMKTHQAPGTISVQVLEGLISFITEQKKTERIEGQGLMLHAKIPHSVMAIKESIFLLTLSVMG